MGTDLRAAIERGRVEPVFFNQFFLDMEPHSGQVRWLENSTKPVNVLTPGNRWGKSVVEGSKHLRHAFYKLGPGWQNFHFKDKKPTHAEWMTAPYSTINVSISADQAEIVFREAVTLAMRPKFAPFVKAIRSTPFPHIVLWNGSIIHARSTSDNGKYIDGHHFGFMSYDEAGWEPQLDWLMGTVLLPRLLDWGGNLDLVGTPKGLGYLYQMMMRGLNGDERVYSQSGSSYENDYIERAQLEELEAQLMAISPRLARQAIYGDFVEVDGLVFTFDQIQGNMVRAEEFRTVKEQVAYGSEYICERLQPDPTRRYMVAFDLARKSDRTVGTVLDITSKPFGLARQLWLQGAPWETQYEYIRRYGQMFNCAPVIDSTGLGDVVSSELTKRGVDHVCFDFNDGKGLLKQQLITNLQLVLDYGRPLEDDGREWGLLRSGLIPPLLEELSVYAFEDRKLKTDGVMSLAMAVWHAFRVQVLPTAVRRSMKGRVRR